MKAIIGFSLPLEIIIALKSYCTKNDKTQTGVVTAALEDYLRRVQSPEDVKLPL